MEDQSEEEQLIQRHKKEKKDLQGDLKKISSFKRKKSTEIY